MSHSANESKLQHLERMRLEMESRRQARFHRDMAARQRELHARSASREARARVELAVQAQREAEDARIAKRQAQIRQDMQRLYATPTNPRAHDAGPKDARTVRSVLPEPEPTMPEIGDIGSPERARRSPRKPATFSPALNHPFLDAQADVVGKVLADKLQLEAESEAAQRERRLQNIKELRQRKERAAAKKEELRRELDEKRWHNKQARLHSLQLSQDHARRIRESVVLGKGQASRVWRETPSTALTPLSRASTPSASTPSLLASTANLLKGSDPQRRTSMVSTLDSMRPYDGPSRYSASRPGTRGGGGGGGAEPRPASQRSLRSSWSEPFGREPLRNARPSSRDGSSVPFRSVHAGRDAVQHAPAGLGASLDAGAGTGMQGNPHHAWWAAWLETEAPQASMHLRDVKALQL
eukprot:Transcript_25866.p2 GENE.Transcript_25866~~Transcript_25866.p2  ORF type:complete len:412 (-),score=142.30 Transcript_25866:41-1276(-)